MAFVEILAAELRSNVYTVAISGGYTCALPAPELLTGFGRASKAQLGMSCGNSVTSGTVVLELHSSYGWLS